MRFKIFTLSVDSTRSYKKKKIYQYEKIGNKHFPILLLINLV